MKTVRVHDSVQDDYSYELIAPIGDRFDSEFKPQLTPAEMLELGVFGGHYFGRGRRVRRGRLHRRLAAARDRAARTQRARRERQSTGHQFA